VRSLNNLAALIVSGSRQQLPDTAAIGFTLGSGVGSGDPTHRFHGHRLKVDRNLGRAEALRRVMLAYLSGAAAE
jgi:hypothetical protein